METLKNKFRKSVVPEVKAALNDHPGLTRLDAAITTAYFIHEFNTTGSEDEKFGSLAKCLGESRMLDSLFNLALRNHRRGIPIEKTIKAAYRTSRTEIGKWMRQENPRQAVDFYIATRDAVRP